MRTNFRAFADLWVVILIKIPGLYKARIYDVTHFSTKVRVFIMVELIYIIPFTRCMFQDGGGYIKLWCINRFAPSCSPSSPAQLLVQLCKSGCKALQWGKWDLLCEMRPICGPFHQFGPHANQVRNCRLLWKQWLAWRNVKESKIELFHC